jgi:hypothetical protein
VGVFEGGVSEASPLLIQLLTPPDKMAKVREWYACGNNATGGASRPILYRPSVPGNIAGIHPPPVLSHSGVSTPNVCAFNTFFVTPPATPPVSISNFLLPIRVKWMAGRDQEYLVGFGEAVVLYAQATAGHSWSARFVWEEV